MGHGGGRAGIWTEESLEATDRVIGCTAKSGLLVVVRIKGSSQTLANTHPNNRPKELFGGYVYCGNLTARLPGHGVHLKGRLVLVIG